MAKGVGLRLLSRRGSWVQIPPSAPSILSFKLKWILPSGDFTADNESFYNKKHKRIMRAALNMTRQILTAI